MSHLPSTNVGVRYIEQSAFEDANPGIQIWVVELKFDGPAPDTRPEVRFAGNASASQKRAAVRDVVNAHLAQYEPETAPLTDSSIQISGQPV